MMSRSSDLKTHHGDAQHDYVRLFFTAGLWIEKVDVIYTTRSFDIEKYTAIGFFLDKNGIC